MPKMVLKHKSIGWEDWTSKVVKTFGVNHDKYIMLTNQVKQIK
jgi:hypothetical protein